MSLILNNSTTLILSMTYIYIHRIFIFKYTDLVRSQVMTKPTILNPPYKYGKFAASQTNWWYLEYSSCSILYHDVYLCHSRSFLEQAVDSL